MLPLPELDVGSWGPSYIPYAFVVSTLWPEPFLQPSAVLFLFVLRCYKNNLVASVKKNLRILYMAF